MESKKSLLLHRTEDCRDDGGDHSQSKSSAVAQEEPVSSGIEAQSFNIQCFQGKKNEIDSFHNTFLTLTYYVFIKYYRRKNIITEH